jgi:D-lactate dehydrogenase
MGHMTAGILGNKTIAALTRSAERLLGQRLPKWNEAMPSSPRRIPKIPRAGAKAVYFPACLTRVMGKPQGEKFSLIETFLTVAERAGFPVWIPTDLAGHCCGMPFGSKGYTLAHRETLHRLMEKFWVWSEGGKLPIVIDASSCAYTLRACAQDLNEEDRERWRRLEILDSVEFVHDFLLPALGIKRLPDHVILHPNCAGRKLELVEKLKHVCEACAGSVTIPQQLECCAFAGDRGLLFPELTASAVQLEAREVNAHEYEGYYSSNLTCELGLRLATGKPYRSFLYLVEAATKRLEGSEG